MGLRAQHVTASNRVIEKLLAKLKKLRWLRLRDNEVTRLGAEDLQQALPGCKIIRK